MTTKTKATKKGARKGSRHKTGAFSPRLCIYLGADERAQLEACRKQLGEESGRGNGVTASETVRTALDALSDWLWGTLPGTAAKAKEDAT